MNNLPLDNCPISCYIIPMITNDPNNHPNAELDKSDPLRDMIQVDIEEIDQHWEGMDEWVGE